MQTPNETDRGKSSPLNHPSSEDWMSYLYGEAEANARASLSEHLEQCPECQRHVEHWREGMEALENWPLPKRRPLAWSSVLSRPLKWAMAACLALGFGYGLGRVSSAGPDPGLIRAQIDSSVRTALVEYLQRANKPELETRYTTGPAEAEGQDRSIGSEPLNTQFATYANHTLRLAEEQMHQLLEVYDGKHRRELNAIVVALNELNSKLTRQSDHQLAFRREVETVALLTEASLRRTQEQMVQLASYARPQRLSVNPARELNQP